MATRIFVILLGLGYLGVMIWGIIISGKRRKGDWFKLLSWNVSGFLDNIWRTRPK